MWWKKTTELKKVFLTTAINGLRSRIAPMMATSETRAAQTPPTISSAAPEKALPVTNPKLFWEVSSKVPTAVTVSPTTCFFFRESEKAGPVNSPHGLEEMHPHKSRLRLQADRYWKWNWIVVAKWKSIQFDWSQTKFCYNTRASFQRKYDLHLLCL